MVMAAVQPFGRYVQSLCQAHQAARAFVASCLKRGKARLRHTGPISQLLLGQAAVFTGISNTLTDAIEVEGHGVVPKGLTPS
ncbi:hypothetical protein D9M71_758310 [compost metagenome]